LDDQPQPSQELQQFVDQLYLERRRSQRRWAVVGVLIVAATAAVYTLGFRYRAELFRPNPNMEEIESAAFSTSNDPACREMVSQIDALQVRWKEKKASLRELLSSTDAAALQAGRDELKRFLDAYRVERRRLSIIIVHDQEVPADLLRYLKHVLHYLTRMDELLQARQQELSPPPPPTDAPAPPAAKADEKPPAERYSAAWSAVSEDHEKWRVFRQGPIFCGKRVGEVPPLPDAIEVGAPEPKPVRLKAP
jgi:hypothetical protein